MELLKWFIENNQKIVSSLLVVAGLILVMAWPTMTVVLYLERIGYFTNIYQAEHHDLKLETQSHLRQMEENGRKMDMVGRGIDTNREIIEDWLEESAYLARRNCINTAKTEENRDACLKTRWQRKIGGQP